MRKFIDILITIVMIVVIIFAFLIVGMRLFGLKPYAVISGSMEPTYHVGSLIYVKKATPAELVVGDSITYLTESGVVVTHRIIEVLPDEDNPDVVRYRTKGDANEDADGDPVHINNVIGKPVFTIPLIGYVAHFVQNPPGSYLMILTLLVLVILSFLPNLIDNVKALKTEIEQDKAANQEITVELNEDKANLNDHKNADAEISPLSDSTDKTEE